MSQRSMELKTQKEEEERSWQQADEKLKQREEELETLRSVMYFAFNLRVAQ